jgi:thiamine-monophosphate kinase
MLEDKNQKPTELEEIGPYKLAERLFRVVNALEDEEEVVLNDCCYDEDSKLLFHSENFIEGLNFDLMYMPLKHIGYKCIVVSINHLLANNVIPEAVAINLSISNRFSVEQLEEIALGMQFACKHYNVKLSNLTTEPNLSGLTINVLSYGKSESSPIKISTANENDLIFSTGDLGAAYMGLLLLEREKKVFIDNPEMQPDLDGKDYVLERYIKPEAFVSVIKLFKDLDLRPTAMILNKVGLSAAVMQICKASHKGCMLYDNKIPIDMLTCTTAEQFNLAPITAAMNGGEDYELVFTIAKKDYDKIKDVKDIHAIGHITEENAGMYLVPENGSLIELKAQGMNESL